MTTETQPYLTKPERPHLGFWIQVRDVGIVIAFLAWLVWLAFPGSASDDRILALGTVQNIRYVGSFGFSTQIDVRDAQGVERNLLTTGVSQLRKGQDVELRVGFYRSELCSIDRSVCEALRGNPQ